MGPGHRAEPEVLPNACVSSTSERERTWYCLQCDWAWLEGYSRHYFLEAHGSLVLGSPGSSSRGHCHVPPGTNPGAHRWKGQVVRMWFRVTVLGGHELSGSVSPFLLHVPNPKAMKSPDLWTQAVCQASTRLGKGRRLSGLLSWKGLRKLLGDEQSTGACRGQAVIGDSASYQGWGTSGQVYIPSPGPSPGLGQALLGGEQEEKGCQQEGGIQSQSF